MFIFTESSTRVKEDWGSSLRPDMVLFMRSRPGKRLWPLHVELVLSLKCIFQSFFFITDNSVTLRQHAIMQIGPLGFFRKIYTRRLLPLREYLVLVNNHETFHYNDSRARIEMWAKFKYCWKTTHWNRRRFVLLESREAKSVRLWGLKERGLKSY